MNFGGFDEFLIEAALRLLLENHSLWRVSSQYILAFLSYALEPWVGHAQRIVSMFKTHLASPLKKKKKITIHEIRLILTKRVQNTFFVS